MVDLPSYDYEDDNADGEIKLKKENTDQVANYINGMN